jgi:hypothetical protein
MSPSQQKYEVPELLYEEPKPGEQPSPFPFIIVKKDKSMPPVLFIEERKETGEIEPDEKGNPQEIIDCLMHKYVDLEILKEKLPPHINDLVRTTLGMQPIKKAQEEGKKTLDKVNSNVERLKEEMLKKITQQNTKKEEN